MRSLVLLTLLTSIGAAADDPRVLARKVAREAADLTQLPTGEVMIREAFALTLQP